MAIVSLTKSAQLSQPRESLFPASGEAMPDLLSLIPSEHFSEDGPAVMTWDVLDDTTALTVIAADFFDQIETGRSA
jgi:hypothetical protein